MYKILVVDDEPNIVKVFETFLIKNGFEVIKAPGGEEAREILNSTVQIDLMLLDMKMPKVSGLDVINEMVRINKKIATIVLTGSIDAEKYLIDLKALGYSREDILYKPTDLFVLLGLIKNKLGIA
ncbi:MAG: response regulator [Candidatus Omnitrophota bacterium]|nr:response regulator [Candidatus Omnitrophota bacterium]